MTLTFARNKVVEVEASAAESLTVSWRLADTLMEAGIRMKFQLPDLEIMEAEARVGRTIHPECASAAALVQKAVGVRVGPGLRKIVRGLMGGPAGCEELAEGVLECCDAVILHFTVPQIQAQEKMSEEERNEHRQAMLRLNPRLVRSCIAFADDSPLMQGLNL